MKKTVFPISLNATFLIHIINYLVGVPCSQHYVAADLVLQVT